jgi:hypothetical protein
MGAPSPGDAGRRRCHRETLAEEDTVSSSPWTYLPSHGGPLAVDRPFYDRLARETSARTLVDRFIIPSAPVARGRSVQDRSAGWW